MKTNRKLPFQAAFLLEKPGFYLYKSKLFPIFS